MISTFHETICEKTRFCKLKDFIEIFLHLNESMTIRHDEDRDTIRHIAGSTTVTRMFDACLLFFQLAPRADFKS